MGPIRVSISSSTVSIENRPLIRSLTASHAATTTRVYGLAKDPAPLEFDSISQNAQVIADPPEPICGPEIIRGNLGHLWTRLSCPITRDSRRIRQHRAVEHLVRIGEIRGQPASGFGDLLLSSKSIVIALSISCHRLIQWHSLLDH